MLSIRTAEQVRYHLLMSNMDTENKICDHLNGSECALGKYHLPHASVCLSRCEFRELDGAKMPRNKKSPVIKYLQIEASNILEGRVSEEVENARKAICEQCNLRLPVIRDTRAADGFGWCSACTCGATQRALLLTKIQMPKSRCPLTPAKWTEANGTGATAQDAISAVKGVTETIKNKLFGNL